MARILVTPGWPGAAFMLKRILAHDSQHEAIEYESASEALYAAINTHFDLAILGHIPEHIFDLDLAHALTLYDPALPLMLFTPFIPREHEIAIARIPFKDIFLMPLSPQGILSSVLLYART